MKRLLAALALIALESLSRRRSNARGDGDGFLYGTSGRVWGRHGAAGTLLVRGRGDSLEVLLVQRSYEVEGGGGQWAIPGGARDSHETYAEAGLREFEEEVGEIRDGEILGTHVFRHPSIPWEYHTLVVRGDVDRGGLLNWESLGEPQWFSVEELGGLDIFEPVRRAMPELLRLARG